MQKVVNNEGHDITKDNSSSADYAQNVSSQQTDFLKHLFVPVYLPAILFATGEGALIPVVPLTAKDLGANTAMAGLISGLLMIGVVLGDLPSGYVVKKWGETFAMRLAATIAIVSAIACWKAPNLVLLAIGVLLIGMASATFNLARHAFLTEWTPMWYRARAMSLLGGTTRIGYFVGPLIASPVIAVAGSHSVYWIHVIACIAVIVALQIMQDPETAMEQNPAALEAHNRRMKLVKEAEAELAEKNKGKKKHLSVITYFPILIRMGTSAGILQLLRASRQVILPLWGTQLGIAPEHIALITGIAGAVDLSLFYTSGQVMDKFGRKWAALPVLIGMGLAHVILPLATVTWGYVVVAILISLANGLGSGIVMTLGSDLASRYAPENMSEFLGGWRMFTDAGSAVGPLAISGLTALVSLSFAAIFIGCIGFAGAYMMQRWLSRYVGK